jgi:hypothetical protein
VDRCQSHTAHFRKALLLYRPVNAIVAVVKPGAVTLTAPIAVAVAVGLNATVTAHVPPDANVTPTPLLRHVVLCTEYSALPLVLTPPTASDDGPGFVYVNVFVTVVPLVTVPKLKIPNVTPVPFRVGALLILNVSGFDTPPAFVTVRV